MKTFVRRGKTRITLISLVLFVTLVWDSEAIPAKETKTERHTLTWSTPATAGETPTYRFDGKAYPEAEIGYFGVPETHLDSNSVLDIYIPDEVKVDGIDFPIPLTSSAIFYYWLRARVQIVYHYKGHFLPRRILVARLHDGVIFVGEAEVSLDGKPFGSGKAAWDKLKELEWAPRTIVDVFFIHEYRHYLNGPGDSLPGTFKRKLRESNVILNGFSHEYTDDRDPWPKK